MWRLEKWLERARAVSRSRGAVPPVAMEALEDAIQDHRELLLELDSHKSLMMSVNVIAAHLAEHSRDRPRVERLQARLGAANGAWDRACEDAADWQARLQTALLEVRITKERREELDIFQGCKASCPG